LQDVTFNLAGGGLLYRILPDRLVGSVGVCVGAILITWVPLLILCLIAGTVIGSTVDIPFLSDPLPHARLLISLPVLVAAPSLINRRLSYVVRYLWNAGIVIGEDRPRFEKAARDASRRSASIGADVLVLIIAYATALSAAWLAQPEGLSTWLATDVGSGTGMATAGGWYWLVSLPLAHYIAFRCIWRVIIWWRFLWRFSRLNLHIVPTHPDRAGGLGILGVGQLSFLVVVFATSANLAAGLASATLRDALALSSLGPTIVVYLLLSLLFVFGPLFAFVKRLSQARHRGLVDYGLLGGVLFGAFDDKWAAKNDAEQRSLLGDADPSSLADYGYAYEVVSEMQVVPVSRRNLVQVAAVTLAPLTTLLLLQYSVREIFLRLLGALG